MRDDHIFEFVDNFHVFGQKCLAFRSMWRLRQGQITRYTMHHEVLSCTCSLYVSDAKTITFADDAVLKAVGVNLMKLQVITTIKRLSFCVICLKLCWL